MMRLSSRAGGSKPSGVQQQQTQHRQRTTATRSTVCRARGGEQKGEGIYFDYEPVDDAPTNPKLLEIGA